MLFHVTPQLEGCLAIYTKRVMPDSVCIMITMTEIGLPVMGHTVSDCIVKKELIYAALAILQLITCPDM